MKKRVLSGVQPTGNLHIGNYLGAIRNWVEDQDRYENFFCVVDLHALTAEYNPDSLAQDTYTIAALYLACGIDPKKSTIFVQSQVAAHSQLCWLLNCVTSLNWLERMIQFKEKSVKQGENVSVGLVDYPVLMAADILLYQADLVPVGEDQKQHLELCRDIAIKFNGAFAQRVSAPPFKVPEALIPRVGARVMSLLDGSVKMSKSEASDLSRINLLDSADSISNKIKRCRTDSIEGLEFDNPERAQCTNLLTIYQRVTGKSRQQIESECASMRWSQFKPLLAEAVIDHLAPIQHRYRDIMDDMSGVKALLADGQSRAEAVANDTLDRAHEAMGLLPALRRAQCTH